MVLALQGGMAVGKTTAARYTAAHASAVTVFFEDNAPALAALRGRGLDKHKFADYWRNPAGVHPARTGPLCPRRPLPLRTAGSRPAGNRILHPVLSPHPWAGLARGTGTGGGVGLPAPLSHQPHAVFACVRSCSTAAPKKPTPPATADFLTTPYNTCCPRKNGGLPHNPSWIFCRPTV